MCKKILCFLFLFSSYIFGMDNSYQILCEIIPILRHYISYNDTQSLVQTNKSIQKRTLQILDDDLDESYHTMMSEWYEDPPYTSKVVHHPFGAIGYLRMICSSCYKKTPYCGCVKNKNYLGMLVRRQKRYGNTMLEYKSFLIHKYTEELVEWYCKGLYFQCKGLITPINTSVHFPRDTLHIRETDLTTHFISDPYFNFKGDICVLEGLKSKQLSKDNRYAEYHLATMYECALTGTNKCTRRQVYFTFAGKKYPFGRLNFTPLLFDLLVEKIVNNQCSVKRTLDETIFSIHDFFKKYIPEEGLMPTLAIILDNENKIDTIDSALKKALCCKYTGNEKLALEYLYDADINLGTIIKGCNRIVSYFGMFYTNSYSFHATYAAIDYKKIFASLTDLNSIEKLKRKKPQIYQMPGYLIKILKKPLDCHLKICIEQNENWFVHQKLKIINCTNIDFNQLKMQNISDVHKLEKEYTNSSGLPIYAYTLANEYFKTNNKQHYIDQLQEDYLAILLKSLHVIQHSDASYIKKNLLGRFCPHAPDAIVYSPNFIDEDNKLTDEQLNDLYIRNNLEKIIDNTIPGLSFDENDYTQEEKLNNAILPLPKTCMQLVSYLDKAVEWHNPSA
ncbi:MAG TPA: hypothetical protein VGW78_00385, partial [Candidatus Babeliales bacterium]|nr:hypothetical protein [Candidatus Babeliales bacterium]